VQRTSVQAISLIQQETSLGWEFLAVLERVTALFLMLLLLPVLICAAIAICLLSRQTPLVAHNRAGQEGRSLWVFKLRTIWVKNAGAKWRWIDYISPTAPVLSPDRKAESVTSHFAACCRRYSIDELPQLWNVVCGDMAFVGPRPITQSELAQFYGSDANLVLSVKPGLSGLWQVSGRSRLKYAQRRRLDVFLVRHWSPALYTHILWRTVPSVLSGRNAW
jgi:exopolysaccharide production protein ExoY